MDTKEKNNNPATTEKKKLSGFKIFLIISGLAFILIAALGGSSLNTTSESSSLSQSQQSPNSSENDTNNITNNTVKKTSSTTEVPKQASVVVPLSEVVQNFDKYYNGYNSPIDLEGTVIKLVPVDPNDSTSVIFGNTAILKDGNYRGAVYNIPTSEFQKLAIGDIAEIHGTLHQPPWVVGDYLTIHIYDVSSIAILGQTNTTPIQELEAINYSQFQDVDFDIYKANPNEYKNANIAVLGMINNNFLPSNGNNANYIETVNPANMTMPKIEIEVDNQNDYTAAVNGLQLGTSSIVFIKTYGVGAGVQQFILTSGRVVYLPVIVAKRIDRCHNGTFQTTIVTGSKLSDILTCTTWQTIFSNTY